jgi:hypothetical protein
MTHHEINDRFNFMMGWRFEDTEFCDSIVEYYKSQVPHRGLSGFDGSVDLKVKDSYDVSLCLADHSAKYFANLQMCANSYIEKYKFCNEQAPWGVYEYVNIQKYPANGAFYKWHCERGGHTAQSNSRHLVFMTYLNDVTDAGETEFFYQNVKVRPEKGVTLIWPADWTFTHRGIPSPTQEKMIVTGWFSYLSPTL